MPQKQKPLRRTVLDAARHITEKVHIYAAVAAVLLVASLAFKDYIELGPYIEVPVLILDVTFVVLLVVSYLIGKLYLTRPGERVFKRALSEQDAGSLKAWLEGKTARLSVPAE
jgi:hypothetical protein